MWNVLCINSFLNRISGERCLVRKLEGNRELALVPCNILCSDENNPQANEFVVTYCSSWFCSFKSFGILNFHWFSSQKFFVQWMDGYLSKRSRADAALDRHRAGRLYYTAHFWWFYFYYFLLLFTLKVADIFLRSRFIW